MGRHKTDDADGEGQVLAEQRKAMVKEDLEKAELARWLWSKAGHGGLARASVRLYSHVFARHALEIKQSGAYRQFGYDWPRFCEAAWHVSDTTVDEEIRAVKSLDEETIRALTYFDAPSKTVIMLRQAQDKGLCALKDGAIQLQGGESIRIDRDHETEVWSAFNEVLAQVKAMKQELKEEKALRKANTETGQRQILTTHRALEAAQAQIRALSQLQPPADLAADADRESWRAARQALGECDLHVSALAALAADPQRTDVLRARVVGHLRMLQGWIAAAVDEIAEQMPPEWAPTIEAEEQDCAVAPALPREIIEEVRQRTIAKGGLTLVPSVGCDNGHSVQTPSDITH